MSSAGQPTSSHDPRRFPIVAPAQRAIPSAAMEDQQALEVRQAAALPPLYVLDEMPENCYIPPEMFQALYGAPGGPQRTVVFAHKFIDPVTGLPIDRMVDQEKIQIDDHERFATVDCESPPPPTQHTKNNSPQLVGGSRLPPSYQSNARSPSPSPLPSSSAPTKLPDQPLTQHPTSPPPSGDGSTCPAGSLNAKPPSPPAEVERNASQASSCAAAASNPPPPAPSQATATARVRTRSAPHRAARDLKLAQVTVASEAQIRPRTRSASRQPAPGAPNRPLTRSASCQQLGGASKPTAPSGASTRPRTRAASHQQPRGASKPTTSAAAYQRPRTRSAPQPPSNSAPQPTVRSGRSNRTRTCSTSRPEPLSHPTAGPAGPKRGRPKRVVSGKEAVAQPAAVSAAVSAAGPRRGRPTTRSVSRPKAGGTSGRKRARPHDEAAELAASAPRPKIRRLQKPRAVSGPQPLPPPSSLPSKALPRPKLPPPIRSTRASKPRSCSLKSV